MKMNVLLNFQGDCAAAFALYKDVFAAQNAFSMKYSEAPPGTMAIPAEWQEKIMHTSISVGDGQLMGCDAPPGSAQPFAGFQVSVELPEEGKAKSTFAALKEGGSVQMEMVPTFWTPLFGMCTDKFGVAWTVSVPGPGQPA